MEQPIHQNKHTNSPIIQMTIKTTQLMKKNFIYRVSFHEPLISGTIVIDGANFGSLAAIYEVFTPEQIGCKVERLWNYKITPLNPFTNSKVKITREEVISKSKR